ncbi:MAG: GNAT family N-acetyltransferase [Bacteroidota bacterium]
MTALSLHYLQVDDYSTWDAFVDISLQRTIFGKSWYLKALAVKFELLVVKNGERIVGGIVLTKTSGAYRNPYLCKYLGVYFADFQGSDYQKVSKQHQVLAVLMPALKKLPSFDYFFHPSFNSYLPFHADQFDNRVRYTFWMDFEKSNFDQIQQRFHGKLRSELKFAERQNYAIDWTIDFSTFYQVIRRRLDQKNAYFPFSKKALTHFYDTLTARNALQLVGVKNAQLEVMAVAGLLQTKQTTTLLFNGMDTTKMQRGANEWLIYHCLQRAANQSQCFDFEGSMLPEVASFYRKFGGEMRPYLQVYRPSFRAEMKRMFKRLFY